MNSYTYTQTLSQPVQGSPHLALDDQRGDVEIRGADQSAIDVMAKESIRAEDENAAKKMSDNLKLEVVEEAGHYLLRSNRRSLADEGRHITIDLSLRVPKATSSEVEFRARRHCGGRLERRPDAHHAEGRCARHQCPGPGENPQIRRLHGSPQGERQRGTGRPRR